MDVTIATMMTTMKGIDRKAAGDVTNAAEVRTMEAQTKMIITSVATMSDVEKEVVGLTEGATA